MPRITRTDAPGCPPLRIYAADELGYIKVVESNGPQGGLEVVARWGEGVKSKGVVAMSLHPQQPSMLAIARRDKWVEVLEPMTDTVHAEFLASDGLAPGSATPSASGSSSQQAAAASRGGRGGAGVAGGESLCSVHLFRRAPSDASQRVLTCSEAGTVCVRQLDAAEEQQAEAREHAGEGTARFSTPLGQAPHVVGEWGVLKRSTAGGGTASIGCTLLHAGQQLLASGGKGADVSVWDVDTHTQAWAAKTPKADNLGLVDPAWVTALAYLGDGGDARKLVVGTGHHEVRVYDTAAQRRPVLAFKLAHPDPAPIRALHGGGGGGGPESCVYVGNGSGHLACVDVRTGKSVGAFKGACAGSIRSLALHPSLPLLASVGLDRYLRLHDVNTRALVAKVFLKQPLVAVGFDTSFDAPPRHGQEGAEENDVVAREPLEAEAQEEDKDEDEDEEGDATEADIMARNGRVHAEAHAGCVTREPQVTRIGRRSKRAEEAEVLEAGSKKRRQSKKHE